MTAGNGSVDTVRALLAAGADPNVTHEFCGKAGVLTSALSVGSNSTLRPLAASKLLFVIDRPRKRAVVMKTVGSHWLPLLSDVTTDEIEDRILHHVTKLLV